MTDEPTDNSTDNSTDHSTDHEGFAPTIRTQTDLKAAWEHLMGPWGFGRRSIWMMLLVDDTPLPQLTEIEDADEPPNPHQLDGLSKTLGLLGSEVAPGARFAFLRSRPGHDVVTEDDRAWARALYDAARRAAVPCEVVHLGTRGAVRPVPPDEVGLVAAAG